MSILILSIQPRPVLAHQRRGILESLYMNGYSAWALRLAQVIFSLAGVSKDAKEIYNASATSDQVKIWKKS